MKYSKKVNVWYAGVTKDGTVYCEAKDFNTQREADDFILSICEYPEVDQITKTVSWKFEGRNK